MELTEKTLDVLKNFATINSNIVITEGNVVKTVSEAKNVLSSSTLDVNFPKTFGLYDLNEFLSTLSLVDSPRVTFDDNFATISDGSGRSRVKYFFSDPENLTSPAKEIIMPETEVNFTLDRATLGRIKKAASVLGHTEVAVSAKNGVIMLSVIDNNDKTSNAFSIDVDGTFVNENFEFVFNISNLKMIDGDYVVGISSKLISHFVNEASGIEYWVALEKKSKYGV
mgnify:CR=1 FL=1|tara:strand:+ start:10393 stop:11067 length:675 start_codon:yes stop_codon:yes gene_type:complete